MTDSSTINVRFTLCRGSAVGRLLPTASGGDQERLVDHVAQIGDYPT